MTYHYPYGSGDAYEAESDVEPFDSRLQVLDSTSSNRKGTDFNRDQHPAPTFPSTPVLQSARQQSTQIPSTVSPRQLYHPPSNTLRAVNWQSNPNDSTNTSSLGETTSNCRSIIGSRSGRGGSFKCDVCRTKRKGPCDKDDNDPTGRCSLCKGKNLNCSERKLPPERMKSIRYRILNNIRVGEILKWANDLEDRDRDLLFRQLPSAEAECLNNAMPPGFIGTEQGPLERPASIHPPLVGADASLNDYFPSSEDPVDTYHAPAGSLQPSYPREFNFIPPHSIHGLVNGAAANTEEMLHEPNFEQVSSPVHRLQVSAVLLRPPTLVQPYASEAIPLSASSFLETETTFGSCFASSQLYDPSEIFGRVNQTEVPGPPPFPPLDETYQHTWTKDELVTIFADKMSQKFPHLEKSWIKSLVTDTYETVEKEDKHTAPQSSESGGENVSGTLESPCSLTFGESSVR